MRRLEDERPEPGRARRLAAAGAVARHAPGGDEGRDLATAYNLRALGEAVVGGPAADAWAYSDMRAMLNPERISDAR